MAGKIVEEYARMWPREVFDFVSQTLALKHF
jgi:hypothetical protein